MAVIADPPPRYESTVSPPSRTYGEGIQASGTLGVRDEVNLRDAFSDGPIAATDDSALERARNIMNSPDVSDNEMFPQYRRNFIPAGGERLTEEYVNVRDKNTVVVGTGTGLGNAYTPTIASPGEGNGIDATRLRSVTSKATQVLETGPVGKDNPVAAEHQNTDSTNAVTNIGQVRRFKLGVGSGATTAGTPDGSRGQFPRPPT
jgi:hypothetical protein